MQRTRSLEPAPHRKTRRLLGGVVIGAALAGITGCTAPAGTAVPGPEPAHYTTDHAVLGPAPIPQQRIGEL